LGEEENGAKRRQKSSIEQQTESRGQSRAYAGSKVACILGSLKAFRRKGVVANVICIRVDCADEPEL
jgi:hypothetical protein